MIRPLTLVTMVAAMGAGLHVYQTKHEVALLDRELRGIVRAIEEANERSLALQAEWAWLNEPERLRQAAQRHLQLEPMQPAQFLRLADLERRLPAVVAYEGPPALFAAREAPPEPEGGVLALLPREAPVQLAAAAAPKPA
ncbi:cell division protein FtsL, partial [Crenalkalicoccus roseus]